MEFFQVGAMVQYACTILLLIIYSWLNRKYRQTLIIYIEPPVYPFRCWRASSNHSQYEKFIKRAISYCFFRIHSMKTNKYNEIIIQTKLNEMLKMPSVYLLIICPFTPLQIFTNIFLFDQTTFSWIPNSLTIEFFTIYQTCWRNLLF